MAKCYLKTNRVATVVLVPLALSLKEKDRAPVPQSWLLPSLSDNWDRHTGGYILSRRYYVPVPGISEELNTVTSRQCIPVLV